MCFKAPLICAPPRNNDELWAKDGQSKKVLRKLLVVGPGARQLSIKNNVRIQVPDLDILIGKVQGVAQRHKPQRHNHNRVKTTFRNH